MSKRLTTKEFIEKAESIHNDDFDYSEVEYVNARTPIKIKCNKHNVWFKQAPAFHLKFNACPLCMHETKKRINKGRVSKLKKSEETFLNQIKEKYGDLFDYSEIKYIDNKTPVKLKCKRCGAEIKFRPASLNSIKVPCTHCSHIKAQENRKLTTEEFIEKAKLVHGDKYDYSETNYVNSRTKLKIKCNNCGKIFWQKPRIHLEEHGCNCHKNTSRKTTEQFIKESKEIYENIFDYSLVDYKTNNTYVLLKCNKCKHIFKRKPRIHLYGYKGCPNCHTFKGEETIKKLLTKNNIEYEFQMRYPDLKDASLLSYDFYIPSNNLLIEYNGEQHYKWLTYFHKGLHDFHRQLHHDWLKRKYARDNCINLLVIRYDENIEEKLSFLF